MLISFNWLRELTGTKLSAAEIRERLTSVGLAVDAAEARGDDYVLDVEVPSNRGDCLSHIGIARELAVIDKSKVQSPKSKVENIKSRTSDFASVEIRDAELCPRYAARVVRGVKIGPSPDWLVRKLETIGHRPINNVADITNYVLHEFGQPLHAFDLDKLTDRKIVVRRALKDETIKTLDGVERKLNEQMLVIADAKKPVAVAGVMGGELSQISDLTTNVLIESAYFDAASVRRTSKLLGLHTEASHRFERGTDPEGVVAAQQRCVALICEIAGGRATEDAVDAYATPKAPISITLRPARVKAITSLDVTVDEMKRILGGLGFELSSESTNALTVIVPSWRHDVAIEEDLVEEIARHTGYDNIKRELPSTSSAGQYHASEMRKRELRSALARAGFNEAINLSFISPSNAFDLIPAFANVMEQVTLVNPITEDASTMRTTLLPALLNSVRHNLNQGARDVCLFELGRVFAPSADGNLPHERETFALVATGGLRQADRAEAIREFDFFDAKGALEGAVEAMKLPSLNFSMSQVRHLRAGQSAAIESSGVRVGSIGRLAENIAGEYKFRQPVYIAEVDLTALLEQPELPVLYSPLPRYPSIVRDVSLLVNRQTTITELIGAAEKSAVENLVGISFVGTYEGEGIADDKRSVTLRFEYRANDHTMRDEEVDALHWPLIESFKQKFNAEIR